MRGVHRIEAARGQEAMNYGQGRGGCTQSSHRVALGTRVISSQWRASRSGRTDVNFLSCESSEKFARGKKIEIIKMRAVR